MRSDLLRVNGFLPVVISSSKILNKMNMEIILKLKIQLV